MLSTGHWQNVGKYNEAERKHHDLEGIALQFLLCLLFFSYTRSVLKLLVTKFPLLSTNFLLQSWVFWGGWGGHRILCCSSFPKVWNFEIGETINGYLIQPPILWDSETHLLKIQWFMQNWTALKGNINWLQISPFFFSVISCCLGGNLTLSMSAYLWKRGPERDRRWFSRIWMFFI